MLKIWNNRFQENPTGPWRLGDSNLEGLAIPSFLVATLACDFWRTAINIISVTADYIKVGINKTKLTSLRETNILIRECRFL
jgi:hypothetical protein